MRRYIFIFTFKGSKLYIFSSNSYIFQKFGRGVWEDLPCTDLKEAEETVSIHVSHSGVTNALKILRYVEQHSDATQTDVIFMRRWHMTATSSRFT